MINRTMLYVAAFLFAAVIVILGYFVMAPRLAPAPLSAGFAPPDSSGIYVSGNGKVLLKPNIATASIGVDIMAGNLAETTNQASAKMKAIIGGLKGLGIAGKDIQTTSYSIHPITQQLRPGVTPAITGYRVNNQLIITIRKIEDTGKVLDAAVSAGANNIWGISFGVDNPIAYQQQARAMAIKAALDKATQLAKAANVTLGKVISISEGRTMDQPVSRSASAMMALDGAAVPVETGELEINVSVEMRFAVQ